MNESEVRKLPGGMIELPEPAGSHLIFAQDGDMLLTGNDNDLQVWDTRSWQSVSKPPNECSIFSANISANGTMILATVSNVLTSSEIASTKTIFLWNARQNHQLPIKIGDGRAAVLRARLSPRGDLVAVVTSDSKVSLWSTDSRNLVDTHDYDEPVLDVHFVNGGRWLVVVGKEGAIKVFSVADHEPVKTVKLIGTVLSSVVSVNGLIAVRTIARCEVISLTTGERLFSKVTDDKYSDELVLSPKGRYLKADRLYEVVSGRELAFDYADSAWVELSDTHALIYSKVDDTAKLCTLPDSEISRDLPRGHWRQARFSPDGRMIVLSSDSQSLIIPTFNSW